MRLENALAACRDHCYDTHCPPAAEDVFPCPVVERLISDEYGHIPLEMPEGVNRPQESICIAHDASLNVDIVRSKGFLQKDDPAEACKNHISSWAASLAKPGNATPNLLRLVGLSYTARYTLHHWINVHYNTTLESSTYYTRNNADKHLQQPLLEVFVVINKAHYKGSLPVAVLAEKMKKRISAAARLRFVSQKSCAAADGEYDQEEFPSKEAAAAAVDAGEARKGVKAPPTPKRKGKSASGTVVKPKQGRPTKEEQAAKAAANPPPNVLDIAAQKLMRDAHFSIQVIMANHDLKKITKHDWPFKPELVANLIPNVLPAKRVEGSKKKEAARQFPLANDLAAGIEGDELNKTPPLLKLVGLPAREDGGNGDLEGWYGPFCENELQLVRPDAFSKVPKDLLATGKLRQFVDDAIVDTTVILIRSFFVNIISTKNILVLNPFQCRLLMYSDDTKEYFTKLLAGHRRPLRIVAVVNDCGIGHYNCVEVPLPHKANRTFEHDTVTMTVYESCHSERKHKPGDIDDFDPAVVRNHYRGGRGGGGAPTPLFEAITECLIAADRGYQRMFVLRQDCESIPDQGGSNDCYHYSTNKLTEILSSHSVLGAHSGTLSRKRCAALLSFLFDRQGGYEDDMVAGPPLWEDFFDFLPAIMFDAINHGRVIPAA